MSTENDNTEGLISTAIAHDTYIDAPEITRTPLVPLTIGASLIVKNEESCIEKCLKSIKDLTQIVILDTGSTDNTCSIIKSLRDEYNYPIDLIEGQYEWIDDYADARNIALRGCTTDWILCLDADDTVPPESITNMYRAVNQIYHLDSDPDLKLPPTDTILCLMNNQNNDQFFSDRILRRDPNIFFKGKIHEWVNCKRKARDQTIIINFVSRPKTQEHMDKVTQIIEQSLREDPDDIRTQYVAARDYFVRGFLPNAIYWFERYLRRRPQVMSNRQAKAELADALFTLGWCYLGMGELEPARESLLKCLGYNPDFKECYEQLAKIAEYEKDDLAKERWELAQSTALNRELNFVTKGKY